MEALDLMPGQHWASNFSVAEDDLDYLSGILLEKETPLRLDELALIVVERRMQSRADALALKYADVQLYNPARAFEAGQKLLFPLLDNAVGVVRAVRDGVNPELGAFRVIRVAFEHNGDQPAEREFASQLSGHRASQQPQAEISLPGAEEMQPEAILREFGEGIRAALDQRLRADTELVSVAGRWFPRSLMLDVNAGHLNLAEAVLDLSGGGPMTASQLLAEIGGLGSAPESLQVFSLNFALSRDDRFDEVGPVDSVLWYLRRLEPDEVRNTPLMLRYAPVDFDPAHLSPETAALVAEIDDEWSDLPAPATAASEAVITLSYPHRRAGTLPLNARLQQVFPTARRTPRVFVTVIDAQNGEEYPCWVVRADRYIFGLAGLYRKHKLPIGAVLRLRQSETPGKVVLTFNAHKARTEYLPLITAREGRMSFNYDRRAIGAEYDDLMILGADDLAPVDALVQELHKARQPLARTLHNLVQELSRTSPQGTVHAKTLYSAVNVLRRLPPGPIFAALENGSEFEHVGNNYWRLSGR